MKQDIERGRTFYYRKKHLASCGCSFQVKVWCLTLCLLLSLACDGIAEASGSVASAKKFEPVVLQLKWFHQFQFAGYYAALHKGLYRAEGLDVTIKAGGPKVKVDEEVSSGRADYGVLASELIQKKAQGQPLVLLAVIMQHSIRAIIVRSDSGIISPSGLIDRRLMLNRNEDTEFMVMFAAEAVPVNRLNIIPKDKTANNRFILGEIDALNGSIGNQPFLFRSKGISVKVICPISYGIDFYGDSLFTSEKELENNPERVEAFRRATLKGWTYAMEHPEEIINLILDQYNPQKSRDHLQFEANAIRKIILPEIVDIGHVNPHRIERIAQIYAERNIVPKDYSLKGFIYEPTPVSNAKLMRYLIVGLWVFVVFTLLITTILVIFNTRLKQLVAKQTAELVQANESLLEEVEARRKAERVIVENEKKYRQLVESTNTIPWELDMQSGNFTYMGPQVETILGYPVASWVGFDVWAERVHPDDRDEAVRLCKSETRKGKDHDFVYRALHADGSIRWINDFVCVVNKSEGNKLVGFMLDITERKKVEEEKAFLESRLQQGQKMEAIGTLAGGIAHDFNNILGAIIGYADLAREDSPNGSSVAKDLDKVLYSSHRAKELVKQILAFSRQAETEKIPLQPASLVRETIKMLRSTLPTTIEIVQDLDPVTSSILADPTHLNQLVMNLCTNAFHAMEETGGRMDISLKETECSSDDLVFEPDVHAGTFIQLSVCDSGSGIIPEIKDRIFDPYFTTKEIGKGTGMGLSIVHGIVKSYGGFITVYSEFGEGAAFHVFLPVIEKEAQPVNRDVEQFPVGKEKILFIDDEEILADLSRDMLLRLGYDVTVRNSSLEALETFQNQPEFFDLVITDHTMPGLTGAELSRRMMQIRPDIPIILCTGYSSLISEEKAKSMGIKEFALKPLAKKDIAGLIRKVLDGDKPVS